MLTRKRAGGDKVAIAFKYCSCQIDSTKQSFKEALRKGEHRVSECWINTIYDNFQDKLLRPDKTKNVITRETILDVLGRNEEDIKDGLTIDEVLPFFKKYKLKLRVYDVFYNLIFKYEPDTPNFNNPSLFCVTDGDHQHGSGQAGPEDQLRRVSLEHQLKLLHPREAGGEGKLQGS